MGKKRNNSSLLSMGLKYKLRVSFYLMSVLPLLVCIYLVSNYILPQAGLKIDIAATVIISVFIAIIGFFVIKEVFDRIVSVTSEAKMMAAGDLDRKLEASYPDEVGMLGDALNQLTQRIRSNMDELKSYSDKTTEINLEIQRRVIVLSSLLQISSLISQGAKLDDILKVITEKAKLLASSDISYLFLKDEERGIFYINAADGFNHNIPSDTIIDTRDGLFGKVASGTKILIVDKNNPLIESLKNSLYEKLFVNNAVVLSVPLRGKIIAMLGVGNTQDSFVYKKEDIELLDIFAKQVAIAVENDILVHRVQKLETKDALTGLYNDIFIRNRLQEEIKRAIAYQRPCAFIFIDIDNFKILQNNFGSLYTEAVLKKISSLIKDSVSDIDRVGRIGDDEFGVVLPEKNKRQAQEIAEDIRKKIEFSYSEEQDSKKKVTVSAGVSENPLDGISSSELLLRAKDFLDHAKNQGRNRVVAFK